MDRYPEKIDLHMHTDVSDGTDTPAEILSLVKGLGLQMFAIADHDDVAGCDVLRNIISEKDPLFLNGVEFSCRDEQGKYHILGYGYDLDSEPIRYVVKRGREIRKKKVLTRLSFLEKEFGIRFPEDEVRALLAQRNPGKPHLANLLVKYGHVSNRKAAFSDILDKNTTKSEYIRPEEAIAGILGSGGVPVLAHPSYGSGEEVVVGEDMDRRLKRLLGFGLQGVEVFYSGFTQKLIEEMLDFAKKYDLYVTAGSDYHGKNKLVELGDTNLARVSDGPDGLRRFLDRVLPLCAGGKP